MTTKAIGMACMFSMVFAAACGGGVPEAAAPGGDDQVATGAKLYAANCASCHGAGGEGDAHVPAVVGKNALPLDAKAPSEARKSKFHTAADVFQFVKGNMPPNKGGSLTDEQYAAIMAFDLKANGVDLGGKRVDATTASSFVLHP
jgi:cytochrome c